MLERKASLCGLVFRGLFFQEQCFFVFVFVGIFYFPVSMADDFSEDIWARKLAAWERFGQRSLLMVQMQRAGREVDS